MPMPVITTTKTPGNKIRKGNGMSANDLFFWANWFLVGALIVGVVSTYAIVASGIIRDKELKLELKVKDDQISLANVRAEEAKAASSEANARAAESGKEAANARLETEKLKGAVSWRTISSAMASELEKVLAAKPGSVNLRYTDGDPEALFLAIQISQILGNAHWQVAPGAVKLSNAIVFGICLPDAVGVDAQTLRSAFSTAKVAFSPNALPPAGVSFSISTIEGAPTLMIGSKKPTLP